MLERAGVEIRVPREDVNDDSATLVRWLCEDGSSVAPGQPVALLETTKTVYEVTAPVAGVLRRTAAVDEEVAVGSVIARVEGGAEAAPEVAPATVTSASEPSPRLTRAARQLHNGGELPSLKGWISARDLGAPESTPAPTRTVQSRPVGAPRRVLLVGGGSVGLQALDILIHDPIARVVGLLDDHPQAHERDFFGYPWRGKFADLVPLYREGAFDEALITVGLNLPRRLSLYELCREQGIPLGNAIDPSARLNRMATMGQGNIICSFVHLGVLAQLGDNNFIAAHCNLDHHNRIGDHNLFGPGCHLSGTVTVGHRCIFGSGVVVQPGLTIGDDCQIASGTVLLKNIPARHAVRLRLQQSVDALP